jgi:ion channel-forming bestrophin family protein
MIVLKRPHGVRLFFVLRGSILPRIAPALAACTAVAVIVTLTRGFLFHWKITLTPVPFSLIGLALAIFLGFRNSAAYDRYWEARKLWGDLVHRSRSFSRQVQTLLNFDTPAAASDRNDPRSRLIYRTIAFAHALRHQLRSSDASDDVKRFLQPAEVQGFAASRLGTQYLLRCSGADLGLLVRTGKLDARLAAEMDATLSGMASMAAGCERIKTTPIPFAYTLLLHRTASLYCFLLPFGLVDPIGFMTPFVVGIVAYTFFGLDALGDEIEDPFGLAMHHLPLDSICRIIEIDLLEALGERDLPEPLLPVNNRLT